MELSVPIIGILRGIEGRLFQEVMETSFFSGLQAIEITMNTTDASKTIRKCRLSVPPGKWLGAGTIRNLDEAKEAADAGAMFFVTPNMDISVIEFATDRQIPIITGAFSPTEVYTAWSAGADMIKVFPCNIGGPGYIRDLKGPFDQIPIVAVGGVNMDNVNSYFEAGANAVGVGQSFFGKIALEQEDMAALSRNVKKFIKHCIPHTSQV